MIHPSARLGRAPNGVGLGVFAATALPRGTITWALDALDQVLAPARVAALPPAYAPLVDRYTFRTAAGEHVLCWDFARFMNHSCEPTCAGTDFGFEVAIADIAAGGELTVDYATLYLQPHERFECRCGSPRCRGWIGEAPDARPVAGRMLFATALARVEAVAQPLGSLVPAERLARARRG